MHAKTSGSPGRTNLGRSLPFWVHRLVILVTGLLAFFPQVNPGRVSLKISEFASLFTTAISRSTITNSMGRILREQWVLDSDITLLMAGSYTNEKGQTYEQFLGIPDNDEDLGRDSDGKDVLNLQTRLRDLGIYDGKLDGKYGGGTVNAVREAQRLMGREETGVASPEFLAALMDDAQAPTARNVAVKEGMSGPVVRSIQESLQKMKLYDEKIDGVFDVDVLEAVKVFQGAYGYPADGIMESEIQKALYYESGKLEEIFAQNPDFACEVTGGQINMGKVTSDVTIGFWEAGTKDARAAAHGCDFSVWLTWLVVLKVVWCINEGEVREETLGGYFH